MTLKINYEAKATVSMKERQPVMSGVLIYPALAPAGDLPLAHARLESRRIYAQALCNDSGIDADSIVLKLDARDIVG